MRCVRVGRRCLRADALAADPSALRTPPACAACLLLPRRCRPAGDLGWYFHFYPGAAKYQEVWLSQVPPVGGGGHIVYASRFPAGTQARLAAVVATCVREACACGSVDAVKRLTPTGVSRAAASPPARLAEPFCTPPAVLPAVHHLLHLPLVQQPQLASHPGVLPGPGEEPAAGRDEASSWGVPAAPNLRYSPPYPCMHPSRRCWRAMARCTALTATTCLSSWSTLGTRTRRWAVMTAAVAAVCRKEAFRCCSTQPCLAFHAYHLLSSAPPHAATATTEHRLLPRRRVRARLPLLVPPLQHRHQPQLRRVLLLDASPGMCTRVWRSVGGWSSWRSLLPLPQQEGTTWGCSTQASFKPCRLPLCPPPQPNDIPDALPSIPARAMTNASSEGTACFDVQPNGRCQLLELHRAALALGIVCKVQHAGATASAPHSQMYQAHLPPPRPAAACADGTTCAQKQSWGQCSASWMLQSGWCAATCGRCTPAHPTTACTDLQPPGGGIRAPSRPPGARYWGRQAAACCCSCSCNWGGGLVRVRVSTDCSLLAGCLPRPPLAAAVLPALHQGRRLLRPHLRQVQHAGRGGWPSVPRHPCLCRRADFRRRLLRGALLLGCGC